MVSHHCHSVFPEQIYINPFILTASFLNVKEKNLDAVNTTYIFLVEALSFQWTTTEKKSNTWKESKIGVQNVCYLRISSFVKSPTKVLTVEFFQIWQDQRLKHKSFFFSQYQWKNQQKLMHNINSMPFPFYNMHI